MDNDNARITAGAGRNFLRSMTLLPALLFLSAFFVYPLYLAGKTAFGTEGSGLTGIVELLTSPYFRRITAFTFWQAFMSTVLALVLGIPGGIITGKYAFRGRQLVHAFSAIPFILPSIVVVLGFILIYGNNGILNRTLSLIPGLERPVLRILYTPYAIILAHGFYNFPLVIRYLGAHVSQISDDLEDAAALLGAGKARRFVTVTFPRILPVLLSAASLVFIFCFMSFALILVLGGGPKTTTIEVEVYRLARLDIDLKSAAVLGIASTLFALGATWIHTRFQRLAHVREEKLVMRPAVPLPGGIRKGLCLLYFIFTGTFALAPLIALLLNSIIIREGFTGEAGFSFAAWQRLFTGSYQHLSVTAIANTLLTALFATLISVPLGISLGYHIHHRRVKNTDTVETLLMLPIGISSILLSLGYMTVKSRLQLPQPFDMPMIVIAHSIIAYPFVLKSILTAFRKTPQNLTQAAALLGARTWKTFMTVELPLIKNGIIASAAFAFAISMGEINASLMLAEGRLVTIPIAIYRLIGSYNFAGASALGVMLVLAGILAFYLIDRAGKSYET